ncbi:MAG TPA: peptide deformylase [Fimbriimonadaceae bacterium]|jgi:peptide deformylase
MNDMEIVVPDEFKYLYEANKNRAILKVPNPLLRQRAEIIAKPNKKVQTLIDEMIRHMKRANGVGLAAPQVGILQRLIVIAPMDMKPTALINPRIVKMEGEQVGIEGCLSIPGLYGDVKRAAYIEVEALDRKGRELTYELEGMHARVAQHEIDHLEGILFTDIVDLATLHWSHPEGEQSQPE